MGSVKERAMTKKITHTRSASRVLAFSTIIALFLGLTLSAGAQGAQGDDVQQELAEVQAELQKINMEVEEVRVEASQTKPVQKALLNYNAELTKAMKEINPDDSETIEKRKKLFEELVKNQDYSTMSAEERAEAQQLNQKFSALREKLQMAEAQASSHDSVASAMDTYQDTIISQMASIDSDIESKLSKRGELRAKFQQLQQSIMQQ